jgi:hypothetical protein
MIYVEVFTYAWTRSQNISPAPLEQDGRAEAGRAGMKVRPRLSASRAIEDAGTPCRFAGAEFKIFPPASEWVRGRRDDVF